MTSGGEDLARVVRAAWVQDGVLFEAYAAINADFATPTEVDGAEAGARSNVESIEPY